MEKKHYPKGTVLFKEGETSKDIYLLIKGGVEIFKGDEHIGFVVEAGSFLGEMSYLLGKPRTATCIAMTDSDLAVITPEKFEATITLKPDIGIKLAKAMAERLLITTHDLARLTKRLEEKTAAETEQIFEQFVEELDWNKKCDLAKIAAKEYFFSKREWNFEKSTKVYTRFLEALGDMGREKEYLRQPVERMMKEYGAYELFEHYLQREYNLTRY